MKRSPVPLRSSSHPRAARGRRRGWRLPSAVAGAVLMFFGGDPQGQRPFAEGTDGAVPVEAAVRTGHRRRHQRRAPQPRRVRHGLSAAPAALAALSAPVVTTVVDEPALRDDWDELAREVDAPPYLRSGWVRAWYDAFGTGRLRIVAATRSGGLHGVLPLQVRGPLAWSPTNWHTPAYGPLAVDDATAEALVRAALAVGRWRCELSFLDASTAALVGMVARAEGRPVRVDAVLASPYVRLQETWEQQENGLSKNLRKDLRRRTRRFTEAGDAAFVVERTDAQLEELLRVEGTGWKAAQGTAIAADPVTRRFYTRMARWAAEEGLLRLMLLSLDGRVVAGDLALRSGDTLGTLKTGYDAALADLSPGKLLRREVVAHACEAGYSTFEFLGADDDWKLGWTQDVRSLHRVVVHARGPLGRLLHHVEAEARPRLAQTRRAWRARQERPTTTVAA